MPFNILSLPGLQRFKSHISRVLTSKTLNDSVTGQYTFQAKPLFNLDTAAIDDAVLPPGNLIFIDVTNNQEIGDLYLKDTENLYYDIQTAPPVDGYDFVSMEYDPLTEKYNLFYIPLTNPVVSSSSQMVSYINQGIIPNTKNLSTIDFSSGLSLSITEIPRFYGKNATSISFRGCSYIASIPWFDSSNATGVHNMFSACYEITSVPDLDFSHLTTADRLFSDCDSLTSVGDLDLSSAADTSGLLIGCDSLTSVGDLDLSNATIVNSMFEYNQELVSIGRLKTPKGNFWTDVFDGCSKLEVIGGLDLTSYVSDTTKSMRMFKGCTSLREVHIDFGNNTYAYNIFRDLTFGANQMISLYVKNMPTSVRTSIQNNYGTHVTIIDEE